MRYIIFLKKSPTSDVDFVHVEGIKFELVAKRFKAQCTEAVKRAQRLNDTLKMGICGFEIHDTKLYRSLIYCNVVKLHLFSKVLEL